MNFKPLIKISTLQDRVPAHALARLAAEITSKRGHEVSQKVMQRFFDEGYSKENLVDLILAIGEKTITNLLHSVTGVPIDFPEAPALN